MYCHFLFSMFVDHIFSAIHPGITVLTRLSHATGGWGLLKRPDSIVICRDPTRRLQMQVDIRRAVAADASACGEVLYGAFARGLEFV